MEPIKIGWLGSALDGPGGGYDKIHRMAFDEASRGATRQAGGILLHPEMVCPRLGEERTSTAFAGWSTRAASASQGRTAQTTALPLGPRQPAACAADQLVRHRAIPRRLLLSAGERRLRRRRRPHRRLAQAHGHLRAAVLNEISPNGEEYFRYFRQECRRRGVAVAAVETVSQTPADLAAHLRQLQRQEADALVYMGYGRLAAQGLLRGALDELGWDPPRIMTTAFMFYLMGFDKFEGWVGIDQFDPTNPLVQGFHRRFNEKHGQDPPLWPNAIPVLAYDTARVLIEGLVRAPILTGEGLRLDWSRSGSCRARLAVPAPISPARRTSTGCFEVTGFCTDVSAMGSSSSRACSNPGSDRQQPATPSAPIAVGRRRNPRAFHPSWRCSRVGFQRCGRRSGYVPPGR